MGQTMSAKRKMRMTCQASPAPLLEDDNILSMILLRLPPLLSSLPRVSLVCKRWRRLVTDTAASWVTTRKPLSSASSLATTMEELVSDQPWIHRIASLVYASLAGSSVRVT